MRAHRLALLAGDPSERIPHMQTKNLAGSKMLRHSQQVLGILDHRKALHLAQIGLREGYFRIITRFNVKDVRDHSPAVEKENRVA
jgi:hypothetical protein